METKTVQDILDNEVQELIELLPYDSWHEEKFSRQGDLWRLDFECNYVAGRFFASGMGRTPEEAFLATKGAIVKQLEEWHSTRFQVPRALIVDDDIDIATALRDALTKLGWETQIATKHEDLHRTIVDSRVDYILLDWRLNNDVTADSVVAKATRLIGTFSDLRNKFKECRPRIVTYSALPRQQIKLPDDAREFFDYLDHWQKPMSFPEMMARAADLPSAQPRRVHEPSD